CSVVAVVVASYRSEQAADTVVVGPGVFIGVHAAHSSNGATLQSALVTHRDFAFIQTAPGKVFIGWGPFEQLPFRRPESPAFFIADFFLDDPHPWRHPASWEETTFDELASRFDDSGAPQVTWDAASSDEFTRLFDS